MIFYASVVFAASMVGILLLFALKRYEMARGTLVGGSLRTSADIFALRVKWIFLVIEWYLSRTPLFLAMLMRWGIRAGALGFARIARTSEAQAHRIADLVSHKRNFERRETKSQFLKQVGEYKKDNGNGPMATK